MMDTFKTINGVAKGLFTEKKSKFISLAIPVQNVDEIKDEIQNYRKEYYDARNVC